MIVILDDELIDCDPIALEPEARLAVRVPDARGREREAGAVERDRALKTRRGERTRGMYS